MMTKTEKVRHVLGWISIICGLLTLPNICLLTCIIDIDTKFGLFFSKYADITVLLGCFSFLIYLILKSVTITEYVKYDKLQSITGWTALICYLTTPVNLRLGAIFGKPAELMIIGIAVIGCWALPVYMHLRIHSKKRFWLWNVIFWIIGFVSFLLGCLIIFLVNALSGPWISWGDIQWRKLSRKIRNGNG